MNVPKDELENENNSECLCSGISLKAYLYLITNTYSDLMHTILFFYRCYTQQFPRM